MKKRTLTLLLMLVVSLVSLVGLTACEVDTHEHTMQKTEAIAATCTEVGNIEYYTCTDCGKLFADEKGETEITAESTVVAAKGHTIVAVNAKEATCTEDGNTAHYKCSVCEKLFSDEAGANEITAESTVVEANGHTIVAVNAKEATCTEDGNTAHYKCSVCKKLFSDEEGANEITAGSTVIAKEGHAMTHHEAVSATCTEDGTLEYYSCSRCNKNFADENGTTEKTSTVDVKKGHEMTHHDAVAATCTEDGNVEYYSCSRCNKNFADKNGETELNEIKDPAKQHNYTPVPEVAKTCTTYGTKAHYVCNNDGCGKKFLLDGEEYKEATDMDLIIYASHEITKIEAKAETCTEDGNTAYYACSACGKYFSDEDGNTEIEANSWVIAAHHTYEENLSHDETSHWYACKNCDDKKDETTHTYGDATFNAIGGSGTHTCTECEYEEAVVDSNPNPDFTKNKYGAVAMWQKDGAFTEHQGAVKSANDGGGVTANNALEYVVGAGYIYEDYLPKINFTAFTRVSLKVVFNKYQWNWQIGLSSDKLGNISDGYIAAGNYEGTMTFVWQEGKLVQTLAINGKTFTKTITDEKVFNGNASANLICLGSIVDRRTIHVSDFVFSVPCEEHTYGEATFNAIGGKGTHACTECGYEETVTDSNPNPDFTKNKYGAVAMWQKDGAFTEHQGAVKSANDGGGVTANNALEYVVASNNNYEDYLPKINFSAFTRVSLKVVFNKYQWNWQIGLSSDKLGNISDGYIAAGNYEGTMTFVWQEGKLVQTLAINGKTFTKTITDEKVFNGNASANLICLGSIVAQRTIHVSDFTFEK